MTNEYALQKGKIYDIKNNDKRLKIIQNKVMF